MRLDAHQHFWKYHPAHHPWVEEPGHARDFLPGDLAPCAEAAGIEATVAVQVRPSVQETVFLLRLAAEAPVVRGVVGWAPLGEPHAPLILRQLAAHEQLVGVREAFGAQPQSFFLDHPAFDAGMAALRAHELTFDLFVPSGDWPAACAFVDRHPAQPFVLDLVAERPDAAARAALADLAARPHVAAKLSATGADPAGWPEVLPAHLDAVLDAFGPDRVMFGSGWPLLPGQSRYADWVAAVEAYAGRLSTAEQAALFGGTAMRIYRLPVAAAPAS